MIEYNKSVSAISEEQSEDEEKPQVINIKSLAQTLDSLESGNSSDDFDAKEPKQAIKLVSSARSGSAKDAKEQQIPAYEQHLKKIDRYNYEESDFDEDELPLKDANGDHTEIVFADIDRY